MKLTVPGRPVPKGRPRTGNGHTYTPKATRDWEATIAQYAALAKWKPLEGPVLVQVGFYLAPGQRGDLDNFVKCCLDGMQGWAYANDSQVEQVHAWIMRGCSDPRMVVQVDPA